MILNDWSCCCGSWYVLIRMNDKWQVLLSRMLGLLVLKNTTRRREICDGFRIVNRCIFGQLIFIIGYGNKIKDSYQVRTTDTYVSNTEGWKVEEFAQTIKWSLNAILARSKVVVVIFIVNRFSLELEVSWRCELRESEIKKRAVVGSYDWQVWPLSKIVRQQRWFTLCRPLKITWHYSQSMLL